MTETRDTVILGSGCAGLTAAIYTARAGLNPLVLEGHEPGGQLSITTLVENFPGWPEGIQGPELIDNMKKQAARFGATFQLAHLNSVDLQAHPFKLHTSAGEIHTRTLIIASGASARWLGLPSEQALIGHGVSSCATCDGFFFRGKEIAVVGGGDSAMEEALFLTRFATKVTLLHRREAFRASKIMLERAMAHPNIELRTNTVVDEVLGVDEKEVKGLRLRDVTTRHHQHAGYRRPVSGDRPRAEREDVHRPDRPGRGGLHQDHGTTCSPRITARWCRACMPAATCRTGATGRRLRRRGRAAWRRWRWRSIWRSTGADGLSMRHRSAMTALAENLEGWKRRLSGLPACGPGAQRGRADGCVEDVSGGDDRGGRGAGAHAVWREPGAGVCGESAELERCAPMAQARGVPIGASDRASAIEQSSACGGAV